MDNVFSKSVLVLMVTLLLAGCGGGSSDTSNNNNTGGNTDTGNNTDDDDDTDGGDDDDTDGGDDDDTDGGDGDTDGGDDDTDGGEPPTTPTQSAPCNVSFDNWKKISSGETVIYTNSKLNCNGFLSSVSTDSSSEVNQYIWGSNLEKPAIRSVYEDNSLIYTSYQPSQVGTSTCFPQETNRNKILNEMTLDDVQNTLGCAGAYQGSQSTGSGDIANIYKWENTDTNESYTVIYDENNKVISKEYTKTETTAESTCQPERQHWDNMLIQESYANVKTRVGCEGISTNTDSDDTSNTRTWGKADGSTNRLIVGLLQGYVISKQFTAKDQISSCTPDYSVWKMLQTGDSYDTVKNTMQCAGILRHLWTTSNASQFTGTGYQWKNIIPEGSSSIGVLGHQISFTGDQLIAKIYTDYKQPFSSCIPTKTGFDSISIGDNWTDIQNTFGCAAKVSYAEEDSTTSPETYTLQYSWGSLIKDKQATYAYVTLSKRGKVESKYIQFSFQ